MIFCLFLFLCCKDNTKKWIKSNILQENGQMVIKIFFLLQKDAFLCFYFEF